MREERAVLEEFGGRYQPPGLFAVLVVLPALDDRALVDGLSGGVGFPLTVNLVVHGGAAKFREYGEHGSIHHDGGVVRKQADDHSA